SLTALSTVWGFMWLPEPRSSLAPHFDGQRALSGGGVHVGVCASAALPPISMAPSTAPNAMRCMMSSRCICCSGPGPARSSMRCGKARCNARLLWRAAPRALKEALRVDVDVELDVALVFGRGGEPFP